MHRPIRTFITGALLVALMPLLNGCSSIARGVTDSILARAAQEPEPGLCEIKGSAFPGLRQSLLDTRDRPGAQLKVLMVHGIGEHIPGYSGRFRDNLIHQLDLPQTAALVKEIHLAVPDRVPESMHGEPRGLLRISRHQSRDASREMLFYELTWSAIAEAERRAIAFDKAWEQSYKRAAVNRALKTFFNDVFPDPMIYLGVSRPKILSTVGQSLCWMFSGDWDSLPDEGDSLCRAGIQELVHQINEDEYVLVSHSLGSRIVTDGLIATASLTPDLETGPEGRVIEALRNKSLTLFMQANQLPLLQIGREAPPVTGQEHRYCQADGDRRDERLFEKLRIVAFSDPNDILSYSIPPSYVERYMDSRLCPEVTNVAVNVAPVSDIAGIEFANPGTAHADYENDPRLLGLITEGLGIGQGSAVVQEQCRWIEITDD